MHEWIPFLQSLVWPVAIAVTLYWLRGDIRAIAKSISSRIDSGDPLEVTGRGFKIGQKKLKSADRRKEPTTITEQDRAPHYYFLLHSALRDPSLDVGRSEYYRLRIWVSADYPEYLDEVSGVTYHLHEDFAEPKKLVTDPAGGFALATAAEGQFLVYAEVGFKDGSPPITIERYLDF